MRLLVIGGCGFLGSAFARQARAAANDAVTLDRASDADIVCDIGDPHAVPKAVHDTAPDTAVHLAAALTDAAAADAVATGQPALSPPSGWGMRNDGIDRMIAEGR